MFKINKLYNVRFIAEARQYLRAQRIREKGAKAFLEKSVGKQQIKIAALFNLRIYLMLTARNGKNVLHSVFNGIKKRVIGCNVAGMEGYHHVCPAGENTVARNVIDKEFKVIIAVFFCNFVAVFNNVPFKVKADNLCVHLFYLSKIIVYDKRQIAFSASEVEYGYIGKPAF